MNRLQAKFAARKILAAEALAGEISVAWDQAHMENARLDRIAEVTAWAASLPPLPPINNADDFFALFDD